MRSKRLRSILAIGFLLTVTAWFATDGGAVRQLWNIHLAQKHIPIIANRLSQHPEFVDVHASFTTAQNGALMIFARPSHPIDVEKLKSIIAETKPPVKVIYSIRYVDQK